MNLNLRPILDVNIGVKKLTQTRARALLVAARAAAAGACNLKVQPRNPWPGPTKLHLLHLDSYILRPSYTTPILEPRLRLIARSDAQHSALTPTLNA